MHRPRSGYRRRGARDGVGFIWFTLIAMPFLMLSLAFATDFARIIMAGHEMRNVADSGAVAAAWQIQPGTVVLDEERATAAAEETVCSYSGHIDGVVANPDYTRIDCPTPVTMSVTMLSPNEPTTEQPGEGYTEVQVVVDFRVDNLIFPAYFLPGSRYADGSVTKSAAVCVPGDVDSYTGGYCERPVDDLPTVD